MTGVATNYEWNIYDIYNEIFLNAWKMFYWMLTESIDIQAVHF